MSAFRQWIAPLAAAAAFFTSPLAVQAAEPIDEGFSKTVKMWDLDLAQAADVQTLYERIQAAAEAVCQSEETRMWNNTRQRVPRGWSQRCVGNAVDTAVREVGNRRLATLHQGAPRAVNL
jgi:UrcA family protein